MNPCRRRWRSLVQETRRFRGAALLLAALTVFVLWGVWKLDITHGDTASYSAMAAEWKAHGAFASAGPMAFSPLYTVFYAWVQRGFPDLGAATAMHRCLIVLGAGLATLAMFRQMMPRSWAWLAAAWWVAMNWHAYYEVHVFGYALFALAAAVAGMGRSAWWRGVALALLGAMAALVRNEFLPAVLLFAVCCGVQLWRTRRLGDAVALVVPGLVVVLAAVWLFSGNRAQLDFGQVASAFRDRNRVNLRQVYPFGYQQRHGDWKGDPWHGGGELMLRDFGKAEPTMAEGFRLAPRAMLEHVTWNFRLLPAGLQEAFFGCYTGATPPDFTEARDPRMPNPLLPSLVVLGALAWGGWLLARRLRAGRAIFLAHAPQVWTWILIGCCLPSSFVAIATQRPRPQYMYPLAVLLLALAALSGRLILKSLQRRWRAPSAGPRLVPVLGAAALVALLAVRTRIPPGGEPQPLLEDYHRLDALDATLSAPHRVFCANVSYAEDLLYYLANGVRPRWNGVAWAGVAPDALAQNGVTDLYLRAPLRGDAERLAEAGWRRVAESRDPRGAWEYWTAPGP